MAQAEANIPTILIVFGATGDLMTRKITPALFHLFNDGELPERFEVVGFSRQDLTEKAFRRRIAKMLAAHRDIKPREKQRAAFLDLFTYQVGTFENRTNYKELKNRLNGIDETWGICTNKLFYLAVPPQHYKTIFERLDASSLTEPCSPEEGWTRVIVEKPFGKDFKTAEHLDQLLGKIFREEQIYRIDHYLGKEMLQNVLRFRFSNNIFEENWNGRFIERIEIRLLETIGAEGRGTFYDGIGALRDVGQNHLLQMLALLTMDHPATLEASAVRQKRTEALDGLTAPTKGHIEHFTFRAQYDGYRAIEGVKKNSTTETYFKIRASLASSRWQGVPVILESGKRMKKRRKEIAVIFRHPTPCLCDPASEKHYRNKVVFTLEPEEAITIHFWAKKPGLTSELEERTFNFFYRKRRRGQQYVEEYKKLLMDCIAGDQLLFLSTDEIKAMWRFIDPIIRAWQDNLVPLTTYQPDTDEARRASKFIEEATVKEKSLKREIGIVGLGKMGGNIAQRLAERGWEVRGYDTNAKAVERLEEKGIEGAHSLAGLSEDLASPRIIWLMVPADSIDTALFGAARSTGSPRQRAGQAGQDGLASVLGRGDIIVEAGNSFYKDSRRRAAKLKRRGIHFVDIGVSGGPSGARHGASLMVGGTRALFNELEPLYADLALEEGYQFFNGAGAGHFVKMIHNGIEYGMMQAIAEGFTILKKSSYRLDLTRITDVYNHGSVIESRLIGWLDDAFDLYGEDLKDVSGTVGHTGEGAWTVQTAKEMKLKAMVIEEALKFRIASQKRPSYTGKVLSALRNMFGGHDVSAR